jgi:hypothetical protein
MSSAELRRMVLFVFVSALLLASALAFARGGSDSEPPSSEPTAPLLRADVPAWARRTQHRALLLASQLRESARRFLAAFARYEVGRLSGAVKVALRETTTASFSRQLLEAPPARPPLGGFLGRARLARLDVRFVSADAQRALVSGDLRRGATPEEFSFLFVRRAGHWLASGPGQ